MVNTAFFLPSFVLVLLTVGVMLRMLTSRIAEMKANKIHPQSIATSGALAARMPDTRASDNFRNLFETPLLFYVAMLFAQATLQAGHILLALAWLYVALRIVHSVIQCSYNKVMHRFYVFLISVGVLLTIWIILAIGFIQ